MTIGILKEPPFEKRVALLPEAVATLKKMNVDVWIETGAGNKAFVSDADYQASGGKIATPSEIFSGADAFVRINAFTTDEMAQLLPNKVVVAMFNPLSHPQRVKDLAQKQVTSFSLDIIPRSTRAQSMDTLSSIATVAGYLAVLDAALHLPKFFPMFMSAAGTIKPAKVLILGAGVAGLQAIATSRKLGAVVEVFDVRAAVKEEVQSLGGKFIEVEGARDEKSAGGYAVEQTEEFKQKQQQLIHEHAIKANVIITTAQIPGKKAPLLVPQNTVEGMTPGSVIIDLAASTGGNCELTQNGQTISHKGVTIIGKSDYASDMSFDASKMFGNNLINFLKLIIAKDGSMNLNFGDEIVKGTCITHAGEIVNERVKTALAK
jgi:NAD(P) transhydrogenase subunit alpha